MAEFVRGPKVMLVTPPRGTSTISGPWTARTHAEVVMAHWAESSSESTSFDKVLVELNGNMSPYAESVLLSDSLLGLI